jgi:hypothetical protein
MLFLRGGAELSLCEALAYDLDQWQCPLLLGHSMIESTGRYLGIKVGDAIEIAAAMRQSDVVGSHPETVSS